MLIDIESTKVGNTIRGKIREIRNSIADQIEAEVNAQGKTKSKSFKVLKTLSQNKATGIGQIPGTVLENHQIMFPLSGGDERAFLNASETLLILNARGIN
jgi:hypothetical protein